MSLKVYALKQRWFGCRFQWEWIVGCHVWGSTDTTTVSYDATTFRSNVRGKLALKDMWVLLVSGFKQDSTLPVTHLYGHIQIRYIQASWDVFCDLK